MRSNIDGVEIRDSLILNANRFGVMQMTLSGTFSIPPDSPHVLFLDPGGAARNVKLPANPRKGDWFIIVNTADALEVITVQDSAGAGLTPACTPTQSEVAFLVYSGDATLGWRSFVAAGA